MKMGFAGGGTSIANEYAKRGKVCVLPFYLHFLSSSHSTIKNCWLRLGEQTSRNSTSVWGATHAAAVRGEGVLIFVSHFTVRGDRHYIPEARVVAVATTTSKSGKGGKSRRYKDKRIKKSNRAMKGSVFFFMWLYSYWRVLDSFPFSGRRSDRCRRRWLLNYI